MKNGTQNVSYFLFIFYFGSTPYKVSENSNIKEYDLA